MFSKWAVLDFYLTFLELVFIHLHCKRLPQIRKLDWSNLSNYLQGILRDKTIFFIYFYVDPSQSQEAGFEYATWSSTVTIIFQLKKHFAGSPLTQTRCFSRKVPWQSWKKMSLNQLRFRFSKQQGRMFHVSTVSESIGEAAIQYSWGETDV